MSDANFRWDADSQRWRDEAGRFATPNQTPDSTHQTPAQTPNPTPPGRATSPPDQHQSRGPILSPQMAAMIRDLWNCKAGEMRQSNRTLTLVLIGLCVVWIRWGYPVVQGVKTAASQTIDTAAAAVGAIAPDLTESPKVGDQIGPYRVSSAYGKRVSPCPGCSSDHPGVDIAAPTGSQQFIPDKPSAVVNVECFTYSYRGNTERGAKFTTSYGVAVRSIHLSKCDAGRHRGGQVFALGGTSGTGPHWHIETYRDGAIFPPPASVIWWMVTGTEPKPALSTGGNDAE